MYSLLYLFIASIVNLLLSAVDDLDQGGVGESARRATGQLYASTQTSCLRKIIAGRYAKTNSF
jgi:hypothetical protein